MSKSIAGELLAMINIWKCKQIIPALLEGAGMSELIYPKTRFAKYYTLNMDRWVDGLNKIN